MLQTPVALFIFNRPGQTERVFQRIAEVQPSTLLVVADGPRASREGEAALCKETRRIATAVTWPCDVRTCFADSNIGCGGRISSGLDWVFEQVEEAIILEDDILPDVTFFRFCSEMLDRYRDDDRVSHIGGFQIGDGHMTVPDSYFFSNLGNIWGWATWRRAWQRYDRGMSRWPAVKGSDALRDRFDTAAEAAFWSRIFDAMHGGTGPDTWDYQWIFANQADGLLGILPGVNLVENIGFGADATHTASALPALQIPARAMPFPLRHPAAVAPMAGADRVYARLSGSYQRSLPGRVVRKLRAEFAKLTDR